MAQEMTPLTVNTWKGFWYTRKFLLQIIMFVVMPGFLSFRSRAFLTSFLARLAFSSTLLYSTVRSQLELSCIVVGSGYVIFWGLGLTIWIENFQSPNPVRGEGWVNIFKNFPLQSIQSYPINQKKWWKSMIRTKGMINIKHY